MRMRQSIAEIEDAFFEEIEEDRERRERLRRRAEPRPLERIIDLRARTGAGGDVLLLDLEVDLLAEHRDVPRGLDADTDLLAHDRQDRDLDVVADHCRLIGLACQYQHDAASLAIAN